MLPLRPHQHSAKARLGVPPGRRRATLGALVVGLFVLAGAELRAAEMGYVVVMRQDEQEVVLDRVFVADAFLKKKTRWPSGEVIHPVDQRRDAAVRRHFSDDVLKRSVEAVRNYWQQRIFSGRDVPPPEMTSDAEVIRYLRQNPGSIGYVSQVGDAAGVRVVTLR